MQVGSISQDLPPCTGASHKSRSRHCTRATRRVSKRYLHYASRSSCSTTDYRLRLSGRARARDDLSATYATINQRACATCVYYSPRRRRERGIERMHSRKDLDFDLDRAETSYYTIVHPPARFAQFNPGMRDAAGLFYLQGTIRNASCRLIARIAMLISEHCKDSSLYAIHPRNSSNLIILDFHRNSDGSNETLLLLISGSIESSQNATLSPAFQCSFHRCDRASISRRKAGRQ